MAPAFYTSATDVRKEFSLTMDKAVFEKPQFISRTHNRAVLLGTDFLDEILGQMVLNVTVTEDSDGSFIADCAEIDDIISTGPTASGAVSALCNDLFEYARDYYKDFELYYNAPNRHAHLPYVMRILGCSQAEALRRIMVCQVGKN